MKAILNYLKKVPKLAGVEIYLMPQGEMVIRYAVVNRKGNRVLFTKGEYHLENLVDLKHTLGEHTPIAISLNGQGIIHRSFEATEETKAEVNVRKVFPNTTLNDFYLQDCRYSNKMFVSLARKEVVDDLLSLFEDLGLPILSVSLGPFAIMSLLSHSEAPTDGEFQLDGHCFTMKNGELVDYQMKLPRSECQKSRFAGEELNECLIIAYSTALCYMADLTIAQVTIDQLTKQRDEYFHQNLFKKLAMGLAGLFLVVLLINFYLYNHYSSDLIPNQDEQIGLLKEEEDALKIVLANQQANSGWITRPINNNYGSLSRAADLLAGNVPNSITLNEMVIFPTNKDQSRKERRPVYNFDLISLQGNCETGRDLNTWLNDIRQLDFCKRVEISEYSSVSTSTSTFQIELTIE